MRFPSRLPFLLVILAVTFPQPAAADTKIDNYNESFYSREFCDPVNTTAWWDTLAGQLKLPLFQITQKGATTVAGNVVAVAVSGDHAYLAVNGLGLDVVDISDPANPSSVGSYTTLGYPIDIDVAGDCVYLTADPADLYVIDISDPTNPALLKFLDTPENGAGVDVAGDYAYVTNSYYGLYVYDVTNPANPVRIGSYDTPGVPIDVAVSGHYAYVADGTAGLQVIDISNPSSPSVTGTADTPGNAFRLAVSGRLAYVADRGSGLQVIDITDPENPAVLGGYDTPGEAYDVAVCGVHVYVADYYSGVHAIDVSNPSNPSLFRTYDTSGEAYSIRTAGNHAFVADGTGGLKVLEITTPVSPPLPAGSFAAAGGPSCVAAYGNHVYVAGDWFNIFDLTDPLNPISLGGGSLPGIPQAIALFGNHAYFATGFGATVAIFDVSDPANPVAKTPYAVNNDCNDVAVAGNYLFVAQAGAFGLNGLAVLDISDPPNPAPAGNLALSHTPLDLDIAGDYTYMAVYQSGLVVVDISNIAGPDFVTALQTGSDPINFESGALSVVVEGDFAYVGDRWTGIVVVDIRDPENPVTATTIGTPDRAEHMIVSGDQLIVACGYAGLVVYDISNPTAPVLRTSFDTPHYAEDVAAFGDYMCVADGLAADDTTGAQMVQVYDREVFPDKNVGRSLTVPWGELVTDFYLYAIRTGSGSMQWEFSADGGVHWQPTVSNSEPKLVDYSGTEIQWRVTLQKNQAGDYPICHNLFIVPNQLVPVTVSGFEAAARDGGVELRWSVHADETIRGFNVYRRAGTDSSDVRLTTGGLIAAKERRYVDDTAGPGTEYTYTLGVVKNGGSEVLSRAVRVTLKVSELALRQNFPNPFNPSTTISFSLPETAPVRLAVYDAAGALVRVLADGIVREGNREYVWDGRNDTGAPVGSGVYFYRLDTGKNTITRKMVLLK